MVLSANVKSEEKIDWTWTGQNRLDDWTIDWTGVNNIADPGVVFCFVVDFFVVVVVEDVFKSIVAEKSSNSVDNIGGRKTNLEFGASKMQTNVYLNPLI